MNTKVELVSGISYTIAAEVQDVLQELETAETDGAVFVSFWSPFGRKIVVRLSAVVSIEPA